uniref:Uncharacterized protein n=1 Tax=Anguilla anguilla TaxID=7936 RepID=A0A0E9SXU1_ANGAN
MYETLLLFNILHLTKQLLHSIAILSVCKI